ncbi:hypothetical protein LIER_12446 [Lithospermum erythrorhizon]|uniref:Malectin-like domain-containing protein n=1 Tax=Lithospermum erythrorhizon TaxID=34254 RepID=A0AAV3PSH4_LITER
MRNGYEVMHRINVGGPKVTPFNDSLWRTWIPDNDFVKSNEFSSKVVFTGRINYQPGGASREVGPDNVYSSARVIKSVNDEVIDSRLSWEFPVLEGYKYLVRMHFCDIVSVSLFTLYFNVYVNGNLAYENLDLSSITYGRLASPFYADFIVDGGSAGVLTLSVGPSNKSSPHAVDGILNGIEVMKINNSMSSFDGKACVGSILNSWEGHRVGYVFPLEVRREKLRGNAMPQRLASTKGVRGGRRKAPGCRLAPPHRHGGPTGAVSKLCIGQI